MFKVAKAKDTAFSVDDILAGAAVKKEAKSSSKVPAIDVADAVKARATRLRELQNQMESLKTEFDVISADFVEDVAPLREELIRMQGYISSVKVPDTNGIFVTVTWKDAYSKVPMEMAATIINVIGQDRTEIYFENKNVITVKKDLTQEALRDLIKLVGPMDFAKYFDVDRWIEPVKDYTEDFYTKFTATERENLSPIVKQYKASVRVK